MTAPRTAHTTRTGKLRACAAVTAALAAASSATLLFSGSPALAAGSASGPSRSVVVTGAAPAELAARITAVGGKVTGHFDLIAAVSAVLPAGASLPGLVVADDRPMHVSSLPAAVALGASGTAKDGNGPADTLRASLGLPASGGAEGAGVTVAVVDTGVANTNDLAGRVIHVDASAAPGARARWRPLADGYGHGTFMAGLIAGNGKDSHGAYVGVAPKARILDVRVADPDGSTSLTQVLRGLDVVASTGKLLNVKVLNLSLSSGSPLPYQVDPLTMALDALWHSGVTVVVPAGNDGAASGTISSPGVDPTLITAGALDEGGTGDRTDDTVAPYSSRGPAPQGLAKPDLVAPGSHLMSLRAPWSVVDLENPASRIQSHYFRGSGTSMATAVTSGAVADILAVRPNLSPDGVKALLTGTAYSGAGLTDRSAAGAGALDLRAALAAAPTVPDPGTTDAAPPGPAWLWDAFSRAVLNGNKQLALSLWRQMPEEARSWIARSWISLSPTARSWIDQHWDARSWISLGAGNASDWEARYWAARSWIARSWIARSWIARSWIDEDWTARSWIGDDWDARSWIARSWIARSWITDGWSGRSWS
jgi:serine protease AprX